MHSQRASSTFCWLPPDSSRIFCSGPEVLMPRRAMKRVTIRRCSASSTTPAAASCGSSASVRFSRTDSLGHDALDLAVFRAEAEAARDGVLAASVKRTAVPSSRMRAGVRPVGAEQRARDFRAARAEQAGEADDLALPTRQTRASRDPLPDAQALGFDQHRTRGLRAVIREGCLLADARPARGPAWRRRGRACSTSSSGQASTVRPSRMTVTRSHTA